MGCRESIFSVHV